MCRLYVKYANTKLWQSKFDFKFIQQDCIAIFFKPKNFTYFKNPF